MACNRRMVYRYNSYITKKILYTRMFIRIKIVELFKRPLSMAYGEKEAN